MTLPSFLHSICIRVRMICNRVLPPHLILLAFQRNRIFEVVRYAVQWVGIYAGEYQMRFFTRHEAAYLFQACL